MKIEVFPNLKQIELTPETEAEEDSLRNADVINEDKMLVYWGDTEPHGQMKQGVKIAWKAGNK